MRSDIQRTRKAFLVELLIYAVLVTAYFYAVLAFLGGWLKDLYDLDKIRYSLVSLALIVGQGVLLEMLTTWLLKVARKRIR